MSVKGFRGWFPVERTLARSLHLAAPMKPMRSDGTGNAGAAGIETRLSPGRDSVHMSLGEWCLRNGLATQDEIDACLKIQKAAETQGRPAPRLGEILVARGILTHHQVTEALAAQKKEIRQCPRCGIQINVAVRGDAAQYRCARCNGPLMAPSSTSPLHAVDEGFILVSKDPVPPEVEQALEDPANRFGKYVLVRLLGRGGIGAVYLAWDTYLSQFVALKRLLAAPKFGPQDTPNEHIQSLLKEARNTIRLRHPGVVSVFDVGRVGREYYVAMEYLEGDTLAARIDDARQQGKPSPFYENPRETLVQLVEIARAVEYAHGRPSPIIHCDLKPANILIDPEGHPHVLDFGLAKNLKLDKPEKGEISGTPSYMAPEQASGDTDKIDPRTDIYAFGAILYELLTGRPPFVGGTMEILGKTIGDVPDRPSDTLRETTKRSRRDELSTRELLRVPPALEDLCMKCLQKSRSERPQSMEGVAQALEATYRPRVDAAPSPPSVTPVAPERSPRPQRRGILAVITAAILLGGSALVLSRWPWPERGASFEEREAEVLTALSTFRPQRARALALRLRDESRGSGMEARASRLAEEASWLTRLQNQALERLQARPLEMGELRLRNGSVIAARIVGGDAGALRILRDGRDETLPWENVEASQLVDLLWTVVGDTEEGLLGLGILCLRNGRAAVAERFFVRLRSTPLAPVAERYLGSSND
jgi:serine/threonine protein kinase